MPRIDEFMKKNKQISKGFIYFDPTEVAEAIRKIGQISIYLELALKSKTPEETACIFSKSLYCIDSIPNDYLRMTVVNFFADFFNTTDKELYPLIVYYQMYENKDHARLMIYRVSTRLSWEGCGLAPFDFILGSKKAKNGDFIVKKKEFEEISAKTHYSEALSDRTLNKIRKIDEQSEGILSSRIFGLSRLDVKISSNLMSRIVPIWRGAKLPL